MLTLTESSTHSKIRTEEPKKTRKKYAVVGASSRALWYYAKAMTTQHSDVCEIVGLCDINAKRMEKFNELLGAAIPLYTDFDAMVGQGKPDVVLVCSKDSTHHDYIVRALKKGCDVITEKPMTIDDEKCRAILEAERDTGKKVTVTFNYRFIPYVTKIKELVKSGIIGKIFSVDFHWYLDVRHGADYFRRWHRRKENTGGLLVHKATHHFDLINWIIEQDPEQVFAYGDLKFYGPGNREHGVRCLDCEYGGKCNFYFNIKSSSDVRKLYLESEKDDNYLRDRCVFDEEINIEDTMAVIVRYSQGTLLTYSLNAYLPYEGWRLSINGKNGRIDAQLLDNDLLDANDRCKTIKIYPQFGSPMTVNVPPVDVSGGHGGGDEQLLKMLFGKKDADPLGHMAGSRAGAMSILTGIAANKSIATNLPVTIKELIKL